LKILSKLPHVSFHHFLDFSKCEKSNSWAANFTPWQEMFFKKKVNEERGNGGKI